ncbi:hypothetical protein pipiens_005721 [Culex pipiens pipiens]|uniref:Uncharacterized protein n=1 Tax=Culex pipiens pipiens TaxID=38569 RepID=A0ABD1DVW8_CULPP
METVATVDSWKKFEESASASAGGAAAGLEEVVASRFFADANELGFLRPLLLSVKKRGNSLRKSHAAAIMSAASSLSSSPPPPPQLLKKRKKRPT